MRVWFQGRRPLNVIECLSGSTCETTAAKINTVILCWKVKEIKSTVLEVSCPGITLALTIFRSTSNQLNKHTSKEIRKWNTQLTKTAKRPCMGMFLVDEEETNPFLDWRPLDHIKLRWDPKSGDCYETSCKQKRRWSPWSSEMQPQM